MIRCKKKKGFTVMELTIVMTLTVIVLGIIWTMFSISSKIISDVNVKSDLQKEGQEIQEKMSNIGMQATGVTSIDGDSTSGEIKNILINSYKEDGSKKDFEIEHAGSILTIDGHDISNSIQSIKVDPKIISKDNIGNITYIDFTIMLSRKKNYNNELINYPINVEVFFRNKYTSGM